MSKKRFIFQTNLSVDQCLDRISTIADSARFTIFSLSSYVGSKPLLATIKGRDVTIWKRIYYRNDFRPYFYGRVVPEPNGARLEGHFGMNRWAKIFMAVWIGIVVATTLPMLIQFFKDTGVRERTLDLTPLYMLAFGFLLPKFGRWIGRGQERFIVEQLEKALGSRAEITDESAPTTPPYANEPIG